MSPMTINVGKYRVRSILEYLSSAVERRENPGKNASRSAVWGFSCELCAGSGKLEAIVRGPVGR